MKYQVATLVKATVSSGMWKPPALTVNRNDNSHRAGYTIQQLQRAELVQAVLQVRSGLGYVFWKQIRPSVSLVAGNAGEPREL